MLVDKTRDVVDRTREVLRLFERAAGEHSSWLMRVHAALMFPGQSDIPPCGPDAPVPLLAAYACGDAEELAPLLRLRAFMHGRAAVLLERRRRGYPIAPDDYQEFMAAVEAYVREARRVEGQFRRVLVETDPLTGVHNRQGMMRSLRREWTRSLRTGDPVCVALADLDFFKRINDTWGHQAGDRVLCATARFFQRSLRPYDSVYRYGGEEFLFCLPNTDVETAAHVLDRLRRALARQPVLLEGGQQVAVTCSIGVAPMVPSGSVQEAVAAADRALYGAKDRGRDRVELAPPPAGLAPAGLVASELRASRAAVRH
ncbi:MAG: GGDEF domain-containing protein [Magnetospirillum sp.]|nr:GGDEF domain-containing protein [Magnetospirillum sp.]